MLQSSTACNRALKLFAFVLLTWMHIGQIMASTLQNTLYINRGEWLAFDSTAFSGLAFNETRNFEAQNTVIRVNAWDSLELLVVNNDSILRGFEIRGLGLGQNQINPGDSLKLKLGKLRVGLYALFDPINQPMSSYLGLESMLVVQDKTLNSYFWNIHEYQSALNPQIEAGVPINWQEYEPDYFTLNGRSNPYIDTDSTARIEAQVGDTILIYVLNSGRSIHPIHFHGFHFSIVASSRSVELVGRKKDSMPIYPKECVVLQLIPDKKGIYPIHNHNLVAVSGGGMYPNGMFLTMEVN